MTSLGRIDDIINQPIRLPKILSKYMLLILRLLVRETLYFLSLIIFVCQDAFLYWRTWIIIIIIIIIVFQQRLHQRILLLFEFLQNLLIDFNLLSKVCIVLILLAYCSSNSHSLVVILGEFIMFTVGAIIFTAWLLWLI